MSGIGMRILNFILGVILILLAFIPYFFPLEFLWTLILVASIAVLIIGVVFIVESITQKDAGKLIRIFGVIAGILAILLGMIIFIGLFLNPLLAGELFILLVATVFLVLGIFRIVEGFTDEEVPKWYRVLIIVLGIMMVVLSILIFLEPVYGALSVLIFVQIWLFVAGGLRIFRSFISEKSE